MRIKSMQMPKRQLARILAAGLLCAMLPILLHAQTLTTVADTLYGPSGALASGQIVVTNSYTFTAADGSVVYKGSSVTVTVTNGAFSVGLVPNAGSTPSGTSYSAVFTLTDVPTWTETWVIPNSATPVNLMAVRASPAPVPPLTFPMSQVVAPTNCISLGGLPLYTAGGWTCTTAAGTGTLTSFSAAPANWPAWLVPTVLNSSTAPSLEVAASAIPNSALANDSMTLNGTLCALGGACTISAGSSMIWPSGSAGIPNYNGSSGYGTTYNASNPIPANFISTLNQNTTGTAANLSGTPTLPNGTTAATQAAGDSTTKLATDAFVLANAGTGMTAGQVAIAGSSTGITSSIAYGTGANELLETDSNAQIPYGATQGLEVDPTQITTSTTDDCSTNSGIFYLYNGPSLSVTLPTTPTNKCPLSGMNLNSTPLTINLNGAQTFNTLTTVPQVQQYQTFRILSDGSNFYGHVGVSSSTTSSELNLVPQSYSTLDHCDSATEGEVRAINDGTVYLAGAVVGGGGYYHDTVHCDGQQWLVGSGSSLSAGTIEVQQPADGNYVLGAVNTITSNTTLSIPSGATMVVWADNDATNTGTETVTITDKLSNSWTTSAEGQHCGSSHTSDSSWVSYATNSTTGTDYFTATFSLDSSTFTFISYAIFSTPSAVDTPVYTLASGSNPAASAYTLTAPNEVLLAINSGCDDSEIQRWPGWTEIDNTGATPYMPLQLQVKLFPQVTSVIPAWLDPDTGDYGIWVLGLKP